MGNTFSNISVFKGGKAEISELLKNHIISNMKRKGFYLSETEAEICRTIIIKDNPRSKWVTVYGDEFIYEKVNRLAVSISKKLKTYVMDLLNNDSDCMLIHLCNPETIDTVYVGYPEGISGKSIKRGNAEAWAPLAVNAPELIESFSKEYIFSEEVLVSLEEQIGICIGDINAQFDDVQISGGDKLILNFKSDKSPYLQEGLPVFKFMLGRVDLNVETIYFFYNAGGVSKGVQIILCGNFVRDHLVTVDWIELSGPKDPKKEMDFENNRIYEKVKPEFIPSKEGDDLLCAFFPEFQIPEGINGDYKWQSDKWNDAVSNHCFVVRFTATGPEPENDLDSTLKLCLMRIGTV